MYKSKKYNLIFIAVILIIAIVVGYSASVPKSGNADSPSGSTEVVVPPDIVPQPDEGNNNSQNEEKPAPTFSNGLQAISYAVDVLNNGEGYTSYFNQTVSATVVITVEQNIKIKKYRGGGLDFTEEWYYSDISFGENNFKSYYSDGENMVIRQGQSGSFNTKELSYTPNKTSVLEEFSASHYENDLGRNKLNNFFQTINSSTTRIIFFDKSDKENYKVKVSINIDDIEKSYINTFEANGAKINKFYSLYLTFTINKKTGYLVSMFKEEKINITYAGAFTGDATITSTEFFYNMNKNMESTIKDKVAQFN